MKSFTLTFILLTSLFAFGQKAVPVQLASDEQLLFENHSVSLRGQFLSESELENQLTEGANLPEGYHLREAFTRSSKTLSHKHFDIYLNDVRVFGARVHLATDNTGKTRVLQAPRIAQEPTTGSFPSLADAEAARVQLGADNILETEEVWLYASPETLKKGLRIELAGPETLHREVIISGGQVVHQSDLHRYFAGPNDTTVSVRVFDPDPLTTAQVNYGGQYIDDSDKNTGVLNVERQQRTTTFSYVNGIFKSENDFVRIVEFSAPVTTPASSSSDQFNYTRDKDEFEDVNVMFHITQQSRHIANLGYPQLPGYQVQVDAHAIGGADQSFFSTGIFPYRLYFGEGGVDDAEDADVILHEFSHAVIYEAAPSNTNSTERSCIEEAICDYFAVSYSRTVNNFNADQVFNWDGHNAFWPGRKAKSDKNYGQVSFGSGNFYLHTDLMASPLLEIYDLLGRNTTDQLVLEMIYNLTAKTTMPEVGWYILLSDSLLNGGMNSAIITAAFNARGIIPHLVGLDENAFAEAKITISNSYGFAMGGELIIHSEEKLAAWKMYDMQGRLVSEANGIDANISRVSAEGLPAGVYLLQATTTKGSTRSLKITKQVR